MGKTASRETDAGLVGSDLGLSDKAVEILMKCNNGAILSQIIEHKDFPVLYDAMSFYYTPNHLLRDTINRYNADRPQRKQLPLIPCHGLRHTSATLLIASHQDIKTVQSRLGHAEVSTTLNIYA